MKGMRRKKEKKGMQEQRKLKGKSRINEGKFFDSRKRVGKE